MSPFVLLLIGLVIVLGGILIAKWHPILALLLAVVFGGGSKMFPWMNDSGFWIVGQMSGFTERETFRNFSFLMSIMGLVGLLTTMILASLFPLVSMKTQ